MGVTRGDPGYGGDSGVTNTKRAQGLRRYPTEAEQRLWQKLKRRQLAGMKFRRQQPIGPYFVDFVCLECGVIIEVDGGQHPQRASYDMERTRWLEAQGYRVLRFWNSDVLANTDAVAQVILDCIDPPP